MKTLIQATLLACAMAAPVLSFAQSVQGPVTRAEVRADLIRLEKAGYDPRGDNATYPADIQAAEAKVAAQEQLARNDNAGTATAMPTAAQATGGTQLQASMKMVPRIDQPRSPFYYGA
ncbi:DUF4148 domain-containing protein [Cupriavidus sp. 30B13]|uniref:DUF4148 domain-containing protein n=1 Tax=Cupriavidus sp. 30B13 TaxID=3384241 RepID=UPI003B90492C